MDFGNHRDFSEFYNQFNELRTKFKNWDSCEKTVALYYLMVGLPVANARFLQNALDQLVQTINTLETERMEQNANDPEFIKNFLTDNPQSALCHLLNQLPLLRPGNKEAAKCYLNTIQRILTEFITPPFKRIYNECVEIMSYVYIHPAFDKEDKTEFKHVLKQVLNRVTPDNNFISTTHQLDEVTSGERGEFSNFPTQQQQDNNKKRSNSLTPSSSTTTTAVTYPNISGTSETTTTWSSQENLIRLFQKPRSYSLCEKNSMTKTSTSYLQLSNSESQLEEMLKNNFPLMKSILSWLKSLRLHKYSWIFHDLTSNQMLNLTENYLIEAGVTKGARQKLLINLNKLKNRGKLLSDMEIGLLNGSGDVHEVLKELKILSQSPLEITLGEDLCCPFVKVMGKVCTQLLMLQQPTDEILLMFNSICEKIATLECFSIEQKKKLTMWKEQLDTTNIIFMPQKTAFRKGGTNNYKGHNNYGKTFNQNFCENFLEQPINNSNSSSSSSSYKSSSYPNMQINSHFSMHRHSVDSNTLRNQISHVRFVDTNNYSNNNSTTINHHHQQITNNKLTANNNNNNSSRNNYSNKENNLQSQKHNCDIENSLESLCIQMMEHALGP